MRSISDLCPNPLQEEVEHCWVDRREESEAGTRAFQPGDLRLERLKTVKSNPNMFIQLQAFVQLDLTSVRRGIEHANAETELAASPERHLASRQNTLAAPGPFVFHGRWAGVEYEPRPARRAPSNLGVYVTSACHEQLDRFAGSKPYSTLDPATIIGEVNDGNLCGRAILTNGMATELHRLAFTAFANPACELDTRLPLGGVHVQSPFDCRIRLLLRANSDCMPHPLKGRFNGERADYCDGAGVLQPKRPLHRASHGPPPLQPQGRNF